MSYRNFFERKKIVSHVSPSKTAESAEAVAEAGTSGTYKEKTASLPRMAMGKTKSGSPYLGLGASNSRRANTLGSGSQPPSAEVVDEKPRKLKFSNITKRFTFRNIGSFFGQKHQNDGGTTTTDQKSDDEEDATKEDRKKSQLDLLHADEQSFEACENELYALFKELKRLLQVAVDYDEDLLDVELVSTEDDLPLDKLRKMIGSCSIVVKALDTTWKGALADKRVLNEALEARSSEEGGEQSAESKRQDSLANLYQSSSEEKNVRYTTDAFVEVEEETVADNNP